MTKKKILVAAIAATLSTGMLASGMTSVFAADNPLASTEAPAKEQAPSATPAPEKSASEAPAKEQATNEAAEKDLVKVSEDALMSMRNLHSARLAIFNGQPERAQTFIDAAVTRIGATGKDAEKYALDTKAPKTDDRYVPFDASLTVLDTIEPSEAKAKHIAKANEHLHKGEKKEALEVLKLGEINVAVTTRMVPVELAKAHIEQAAKLIGEGKYYEANLVLKAVDDAVVVETFAIDALPKVKPKG
jgi:hypothetical protein